MPVIRIYAHGVLAADLKSLGSHRGGKRVRPSYFLLGIVLFYRVRIHPYETRFRPNIQDQTGFGSTIIAHVR